MTKAVKLGQNFLVDKNIANKIVGEFLPQTAGGNLRGPTSRSLGTGGPVLEIGSGPGILSEMLLGKIPAAQLTLVEIDPFLVQNLRQRFGSQIQIIEKNILDIDLARLFLQKQVGIIGNLPYHISKDLIDWFIAQRLYIHTAVLMLQKDFVDKLLFCPGGQHPAGGAKKYNAQSVVFQLLFQARRRFNVSPGSFMPRPKIMSTVLAVSPTPAPPAAASVEFYDFVRLSFSERRKTLWNNLASRFGREALSALIAASGLSPQTRAEQLPPERFLSLWVSAGNIPGKDGR